MPDTNIDPVPTTVDPRVAIVEREFRKALPALPPDTAVDVTVDPLGEIVVTLQFSAIPQTYTLDIIKDGEVCRFLDPFGGFVEFPLPPDWPADPAQ